MQSTLRRNYLILALIEGAAVMAVELLGAKMAAIYYGSSLYVWTSVLSITIGGLAAGYFLGGHLSGLRDSRKNINIAFLLAALLVLLMPSYANLVMKMAMVLGYQSGAVLSCLLFIFPIMVLFGTIPPNIINVITKEQGSSGNDTGHVYTISTFGGIFMTLIIGFYAIPNWGLKTCAIAIASLLATVPFLNFLKSKIIYSLVILFGLLFTSTLMLKPTGQKEISHVRVLHKSDGLMGQMLVADDLKTEKRSLLVNNISQTFMHIPSGRSQWRYVHRMAMYASMMPTGSNVLLCGIGGGNLINEFSSLGFNIDAVDLDARMAKIAHKYFMMTANANFFEDDARHYIRTCEKEYDIIILDMSAGENQPSNVYTLECFKEIRNLLSDQGVIFLHYQNALEGENSLAVKSLGKTLAESGLNPQLLNTDKVKEDGTKFNWDKVGELMLFGSKNPIALNIEFERRDGFADPFNFARGENTVIKDYDFSEGMIFTDDLPILDALHTGTLSTTRGATLKQLIPILIDQKIDIL